VAGIDEAVDHGRAAVAVLPAGRGRREASLLLSALLYVRYRCTGSLADLDEAIDVARAGMSALPSGTPGEADCLCGIGSMLQKRYGHTRDWTASLNEAVEFQ
jgi:hypothetical protein